MKIMFGVVVSYNPITMQGAVNIDDGIPRSRNLKNLNTVYFKRADEGYAKADFKNVTLHKSHILTDRKVENWDHLVLCIETFENRTVATVWIWESDYIIAKREMETQLRRELWKDDLERQKEAYGFGSQTGPKERQKKWGRGHNFWDDLWARFNNFNPLDDTYESYTTPPRPHSSYVTDWRQILYIPGDVRITANLVKACFRRKAKICHPDKGGSHTEMIQLCRAREDALTFVT